MLVKSTAELECRSDVTCFASTMPLLTSSLPGQVQDMPPRCLHLSTLLFSLLADNSTGVNLDEPVRTLMVESRTILVIWFTLAMLAFAHVHLQVLLASALDRATSDCLRASLLWNTTCRLCTGRTPNVPDALNVNDFFDGIEQVKKNFGVNKRVAHQPFLHTTGSKHCAAQSHPQQ